MNTNLFQTYLFIYFIVKFYNTVRSDSNLETLYLVPRPDIYRVILFYKYLLYIL